MTIRMGETYVANGQLTQAGYSALRETENAVAALQAADVALDARVDVLEAADAAEAANAPGSAPRFSCRAWVNFNGTGTVAIRASGNVSSITDLGVGDYAVNFTTAMSDANYAANIAYTNEVNVQHGVGFITTQTAGWIRLQFHNAANSANTVDKSIVNVAVFR